MRWVSAGLLAALALIAPARADYPDGPPSTWPMYAPPADGKFLCIIERAAGILNDEKTNTSIARAVRFKENHRFILTLRKIVRNQWTRDFCKESLDHWESMLYADQTYPDDSLPPNHGKTYDFRLNLGPACFSDREALIKYYDRDSTTRLTSYDFLPWQFNGLPGNWMTFSRTSILQTGLSFEGSEPLDAGPVVIQGNCERIDG